MPVSLRKKRTFSAIYTLGFFFALTTALPAYINSEFLSQFLGPQMVGVIFAISALVAIVIFSRMGHLLKKYGNYLLSLVMALAILFALIGLTFLKIPLILTILFILLDVAAVILYFCIDIFLESFLENNVTGTIRGTFLSIANTAWIMAPILAGVIVANNEYWKIYFAATIALIPALIIISSAFNNFKDSKYQSIALTKIIAGLPSHHSTYKVLMTNFLLQFFYAWMVIYTPIYLHSNMGFEWQQIGVIFTVMLLPFVILEAPLGRLADERWGEKEMLSGGFLVIGLSTILLAFIPVPDFWLWAAGLLTTRIGASTVEVMNETFFFKKTGENHPDIVSLFRMTKPLAFIIAPLIATVLLQFIPFRYLFIVLGLIMLFGLRYSLTLKDTL